MRPRRILYIAYPLLAVSHESCGGAEQILHTLEAEMSARGFRTSVAACDGSQIAGELLSSGEPPAQSDCLELRQIEHRETILNALSAHAAANDGFDLLHDHSGAFWEGADEVSAPVLVTLHLPRYMYSQEHFIDLPANVFFNCVSEAQAAWFTGLPNLIGVVENGIDVPRFEFTAEKDDHILWLGRICQEKGPQIAIEAATRAGTHIVLAGQVYPFSYHEQFFSAAIAPHLSRSDVRFVEQPSFTQKHELLRRSRAVVIPSLVDETSSLVAMEAMACGTPVIAFRRGGLAEVVQHGRTGFLVDTLDEMAAAINRVGEIDPAACRRHVEARYSSKRMAEQYQQLYEEVLARSAASALAAEAGMPAD
jgi:glycosyltransferase involved in cell wall biosynthesis